VTDPMRDPAVAALTAEGANERRGLFQLAIRQPVTVIVFVVGIVLAGTIAITRLPIALTPTVDNTVLTVSTFWEGASPAEIEQNVIDKQEERLQGLGSLRLMTSTSSQSSGTIRLEFATGTPQEVALREVTQKLNEVPDYPPNVDEPVVSVGDPENRDYIAWIVFGTTDPDFDVRTLRDFAVDRIEPALERVPGISEINVLGGREREVQLRIDPVLLAQHGITPSEFVSRIQDTNQDISGGTRASGKSDVRVRMIGQYDSPDAIRETVLRDTDAGQVRVRDVADVVMTYKDPASFVRSSGQSVIAINADREIGSNVIRVMEELRAAVAELNAEGGILDSEARRLGLNGTLSLRQVFDQTVYIDDAIALVQNNIWIGGALATLVLILFLRSIRSVGIVALAIPISVIGAVVVMVALGRSVNVISLAGMAFAVGMVVDNAIVVLENIFRHLEMGKAPARAALDGTSEVWGAVLASTLTTIAVFIPILLIQEQAGQLFRDIALAICAAVAISLFVSITVIPCAAAHWMRRRTVAVKQARTGGSAHGLSGRIAGLLRWILRRPLLRLAIIVVLTGVSIGGTILLRPPASYLPTGNRNLVFGLMIPPPGYNIEQMNTMALRVEETMRPFWEAGQLLKAGDGGYEAAAASLPEVPTFNWMTQAPGDPIQPPSLENYFIVSFDGILFHGGISDDPRRAVDMLPLFSHATRSEVLPGVIAFPLQVPLFQLGGATGSAVKLQLAGPDLEQIKATATAMYMDIAQKFGFGSVQPVPSNFTIPTPEIQVRPDHVRLSELGLTTRDIGIAVAANGDGAIIDEYSIGGETIDLKIIAASAVGTDVIGDLGDIPIATPSGTVVSLASVGDIVEVSRPEQIARVGRRRAISFDVTAPEGMALEALMLELEDMVQAYRDDGRMPPSIATSLAGSASKLAEVQAALLGDGTFFGTLGSSLVLALLVVYLLMCVLFQSFLRPLVIMFSVPLATLGGFLALFGVFIWSATDRYMPMQMLDVLTMLGFVILIGVVVNNAILIVHQAGNFMKGAAGEPLGPHDAIVEAVRTRIRPIFMGTLTSVGGMAPLVLMPGAGSELYRGLGSVVLGGLLVSTIFTIVLVPLLLAFVFDLQAAINGWRRKQASPQAVTDDAATAAATSPLR
jgi:HAE1 family hydrophobic/amphiphilic exporter-1